MLRTCFIFLLVMLSGCSNIPQGIETVNDFQLNRYVGKWYEIARLDNPFERGLSNITATYSVKKDGSVKVLNRGYKIRNQKNCRMPREKQNSLVKVTKAN